VVLKLVVVWWISRCLESRGTDLYPDYSGQGQYAQTQTGMGTGGAPDFSSLAGSLVSAKDQNSGYRRLGTEAMLDSGYLGNIYDLNMRLRYGYSRFPCGLRWLEIVGVVDIAKRTELMNQLHQAQMTKTQQDVQNERQMAQAGQEWAQGFQAPDFGNMGHEF